MGNNVVYQKTAERKKNQASVRGNSCEKRKRVSDHETKIQYTKSKLKKKLQMYLKQQQQPQNGWTDTEDEKNKLMSFHTFDPTCVATVLQKSLLLN